MKTSLFTMFSAHTAAPFLPYCHPRSAKKLISQQICHLDTANHPNNYREHNPKIDPKSCSKSLKNRLKSTPGPISVLLAAPLDTCMVKIVTQAPKKQPPGLQNVAFLTRNQQKASQPAANENHKGAGGRGEALRYIYIYMYVCVIYIYIYVLYIGM